MELVRQILAVSFVFLLLGGAFWWLHQRGWLRLAGGARSRKMMRRLELAERLALTPQHSLHLIRVSNRTLLVGAHPRGLRLLANLPSHEVEGAE